MPESVRRRGHRVTAGRAWHRAVASGSAEALALVEVLGSLCELVASLFSHRTTPRGEDP